MEVFYMIVKDDFLNKIRRFFCLNLYEAKIWTALLSRGVSTAGELSDIGNVPRSRAYDILETLEKKGYVVMKLGKPIKYIAVEPKEVVERVKKLIRKQADDSVKKLKELETNDVLKELDSLHKQGVEFIEPTDLSGAIRGRHNIYSHIETMIKNAQKSITIVTSSKGLIRKIESLKPTLEKLNKKGVKIRIASNINKENMEYAKEISKIAEVKHMGKPEARFVIVDDKEILFMVMGDEQIHPTYDIGVWVNTPYFASAFENILGSTWNKLENASKIKL